ncbi:hypothetical protein ACFL35_01730 [Candidatus Riflebacteria bacterium]
MQQPTKWLRFYSRGFRVLQNGKLIKISLFTTRIQNLLATTFSGIFLGTLCTAGSNTFVLGLLFLGIGIIALFFYLGMEHSLVFDAAEKEIREIDSLYFQSNVKKIFDFKEILALSLNGERYYEKKKSFWQYNLVVILPCADKASGINRPEKAFKQYAIGETLSILENLQVSYLCWLGKRFQPAAEFGEFLGEKMDLPFVEPPEAGCELFPGGKDSDGNLTLDFYKDDQVLSSIPLARNPDKKVNDI